MLQCTITLNLLRESQLNPRLSAYKQMNGCFDFNCTPLAPPSTRVIIHEKPTVRQTWAPHSVDGWYTGPALEHYQCYKVYVAKTASFIVLDTVGFFPDNIPVLKTAVNNAATQALMQLAEALDRPTPPAPFATLHTLHLQAISVGGANCEYDNFTDANVGNKRDKYSNGTTHAINKQSQHSGNDNSS